MLKKKLMYEFIKIKFILYQIWFKKCRNQKYKELYSSRAMKALTMLMKKNL